MNYREYWDEVRATAQNIVDEVVENDWSKEASDKLFEYVDSHEYAIYYRHHLPILQHTDNAEYGIDDGLVDAIETVRERGLTGLHAALAFWAFHEDIAGVFYPLLEEAERASA